MKIFQLILSAVLLALPAQASISGINGYSDNEFSKVDTDNDGFILATELGNMVGSSLDLQNEQAMSNLDKDGDGYITKEEYMSFYNSVAIDNHNKRGLDSKFAEIDTNKDGKISSFEMDDFRRANLDNDVADLFALIDTNADNKINKREFDTFFNQMKELLNL